MYYTGYQEKDSQYYDAIYKRGYDTTAWRNLYHEVFRMITKHDFPTVLEIGCGVGDLGKMIVDRGIPYRGFDFSKEAIRCSKRLCPAGKFWVADAYDANSYRPYDYNIVIALEVLEHLDDIKVIRSIPPGVRLIASIPNHDDVSHLRLCEDPKKDIIERFAPFMNITEMYGLAGSKDPSMILYLFQGIKKETQNDKTSSGNNSIFKPQITVTKAIKSVGRNEPCPCGSGKKYKKCCMYTTTKGLEIHS